MFPMCQITVQQINISFTIFYFPVHVKVIVRKCLIFRPKFTKVMEEMQFFPSINKITVHNFRSHGNFHGPAATFKAI